jgi:hypothetical protein
VKTRQAQYVGTIVGGKVVKRGKLADVVFELTPYIRGGWLSFLRETGDDCWLVEVPRGSHPTAHQVMGGPTTPPAWCARAIQLIETHVLGEQ